MHNHPPTPHHVRPHIHRLIVPECVCIVRVQTQGSQEAESEVTARPPLLRALMPSAPTVTFETADMA